MGKTLTEESIMEKTKCTSLGQVKNLNLWGSELEDVSIVSRMPNVEVLSLSLNKITSLKQFATCKQLQELYLRKNAIQDLSELQYLSGLSQLKVLWLLDNPCSDLPDYRSAVISALPSLLKLDNTPVTQEEREELDSQKEKYNKGAALLEEQSQSKYFGGSNNSALTHKTQWIEDQNQNDRENIQNNNNNNNNENIVCAILSLVSELDLNSLEIVRREVIKSLELLN